ncbi:MAG: 23S rRNA (uracil(1939)-C(5))-methyltransferase RlmD [Cyclobacteriaceae bacterium]|nr:23S rRNA (uracil(1939)-C(5))-methyltransferase RlmD [Cyclobacteriaceae bacterium]
MKKGDLLENVYIETMAAEGKCIAKIDGLVIFLTGGAPGDVVNATITHKKKSFIEARVTQVVKESNQRIQPFCSHFGTCGGCTWQHINYETQLFYKQKQVQDNLERIGDLNIPNIRPILGSAKTKLYRNKLDFTFTHSEWLPWEDLQSDKVKGPALGFHIPKMFDKVFDVIECHLQPDPSNGIRLALKKTALKMKIPFFDLRSQEGFLRTVTIRTSTSGEAMVILQVTQNNMEWIESLLQMLSDKFPQLTSINYIINNKRNDTFNDLDVITWKGNPYITELMPRPNGNGELQFRVGPKSFYQTNSDQAHELYKIAWQLADLKGDELVYDLYTGTGTIANFVAANAKKVIGLEYVVDAIEDAKVNSQINGITNTEFFAGDIKDLLNDSFLNTYGRPDVIITDPPRAGMHEDVCKMILKAEPQRIVYVSCNPATQARDLKILSEKYEINVVQPVDMFPHTIHVENVVSLSLISTR